jgi:phosphoglycolate phosphatase-like HAD superfamily hydrolase
LPQAASGDELSAMRDLGFRPDATVFIGDSDADMQAALAAGVRGVRVASASQCAVDGAAGDLLEAARRACALLPNRNAGESACT